MPARCPTSTVYAFVATMSTIFQSISINEAQLSSGINNRFVPDVMVALSILICYNTIMDPSHSGDGTKQPLEVLTGERTTSQTANDLDNGPYAFWGLSPEEITHLGNEDRLGFERLHGLRLRQREEILALPSDEVGINMDRVRKCWQQTGMRRKEIRVLGEDDFDKALRITRHKGSPIPGLSALYLPEQDVTIVRRNPELERLNGPSVTETSIIHESWHAAAKSEGALPGNNNDARSLRWTMGFSRGYNDGTVEGRFLEEGGAVLYEGRYAGLLPQIERHSPNRYVTLVPGKDGTVEQHFADGMWCAMIFEELIAIDPDIDELLRSSRDSTEQIPELANHINAIVPGLYELLDAFDPYKHRGDTSAFAPFIDIHSNLSFLRLELELDSYQQY